jgi:formylmethanofuran dehydrogenase subunit E
MPSESRILSTDDDLGTRADLKELETIECQMCRQRIRTNRTTVMNGRTVCFDCRASWFEEGDE